MPGRTDLADFVHKNVEGLSRKQAAEAVDSVFDCVAGCLEAGDRVQVPGFGSFSVSDRAARQGVNPATGARIYIAASKGVRFKPGKDLKEKLNR